MKTRHIQPPDLFVSEPLGFSQIVASPPGTLLSLSGQGAFDASFKLVGEGDLGAQADQALHNIDRALAAADASREHLTSLRIYVVDYQPEQAIELGKRLGAYFGDAPPPAQTLIGVQALGMPGMLIEIEAMAVVP